MAGNVLLSLPVLVLFGIAQKHLVRGVGGGG
jgi:ABC-type maltose transport system permease subunit